MTYAEQRAWSERFASRVVVPFLATVEASLPFKNLRITQDAPGWLSREIDVIAKADAIATRPAGTLCYVANRNQRTGKDNRTITIRYPTELNGHEQALEDPHAVGAAYIVHSYADEAGELLIATYVAETRAVIDAIRRPQRDGGYEHPYTLVAAEDGQRFCPPSARACNAQRFAPGSHEQLGLF